MTDFERGVVKATADWRDARRRDLDAIKDGISTGDFGAVSPDIYADPSNDPDVSEIEEVLLQSSKETVEGATHGFAIGHHTQLNILEARKRTAAVRRVTRRAALALLQSELEDGRRRDDQLETLIVIDDAPEGIAEETA